MTSQRRGTPTLFVRIMIVIGAMLAPIFLGQGAAWAGSRDFGYWDSLEGITLNCSSGTASQDLPDCSNSKTTTAHGFTTTVDISTAKRFDKTGVVSITTTKNTGSQSFSYFELNCNNNSFRVDATGTTTFSATINIANYGTCGTPGNAATGFFGLSVIINQSGLVKRQYIAPIAAAVIQPKLPPTGTGNTCVINDVALVRLARGAGFTETQIQTAVAVALAESAGKVDALNYNGPAPGSWDIGLWQINDGVHPSYDRNLLFTSPGYNAMAAREIFLAAPANSAFTPWVAFNTGAHQKFMTRAANAMAAAPTGILGGNSCADLSGGDLVEDAESEPRPEDAERDCSFTLNVFTILKCAFIPSNAAVTGWQDSVDSIQESGPVSVVTDSLDFILGAKTEIELCDSLEPDGISSGQNSLCQTPQFDASSNVTTNLLGESADGFSPIIQAGDFMQGEGNSGQGIGYTIYRLMKYTLYVAFVLFSWNRISRAFGSKDTNSA